MGMLYTLGGDLSREKLKEVYSNIEKDILGQSNCKKQIISGMYRLIAKANKKQVVLMLYGPSGVGKTESAKSISKTMGGELLRIQFSMMQTTEAYNYVFGAEHSKGSFARDMMARESNVILIDEFDKVDMRVCKVINCEIVKNAKKLLKLTLFDGLDERVIVSSIRDDYTPEELIGRKIIVIANLKPAKFAGVKSNGMLIAASGDDFGCKIIFVDDCVPEGTAIH